MRETFEKELERLQDELLDLGSMVEHALIESVEILRRRDAEGAKRLIANDAVLNEKRFAVEAASLVLIATQQPMAGDLRTIAAILEIATELERIGDYGKGIARISLMIGDQPLLKPLVDIPKMARIACDMLHQALDAFVRRDVAQARVIPVQDDEVDRLYDQVYRDLLAHIVADPQNIDRATHLLWVAHNLERSADRVTNICERVVFTVTGEMREIGLDEAEGEHDLAG
jgi:phosphate transport system protein